MGLERTPTGARVLSAFFFLEGILEVLLATLAPPKPLDFWSVWEAGGRGLIAASVGIGLLKRLSFCRSVAIVYCVLILATYAGVFAMAFGQAAVVPLSVVLDSLYQIPSCALLLPYLASAEASELFSRPLLGP